MTEPKLVSEKTAGNLSEGAITHVIDVWTSCKYKRREDAYSKYIEKGNMVEDDGISLVSVLTAVYFEKNDVQLSNEWVSGTPDLIGSKDPYNANYIEDTKCSWDLFTFMRTKNKPMNKLYYWQMMAYMWLSNSDVARLRYCLVNSTSDLIDDEKRKLAYAMRCMDSDNDPIYKDRCRMIERNMIYDIDRFVKHNPNYDLMSNIQEWKEKGYDIPASDRLYTITIKRDESDIAKMKSKIIKAWDYMKTLEIGD